MSQGFPRKEFRGKLAIAITANFANGNTTAEAVVEEISGVAYVYKQVTISVYVVVFPLAKLAVITNGNTMTEAVDEECLQVDQKAPKFAAH